MSWSRRYNNIKPFPVAEGACFYALRAFTYDFCTFSNALGTFLYTLLLIAYDNRTFFNDLAEKR